MGTKKYATILSFPLAIVEIAYFIECVPTHMATLHIGANAFLTKCVSAWNKEGVNMSVETYGADK